jgi:hypothetical protein
MKTLLTREQEDDICYIIGEWYVRRKGIDWNARIGRAKEELKDMICNSHRQDFPRAVDIQQIDQPFFPPEERK